MFKRIEHLLLEVRKNTDSLDSNSIDDQEVLRYFNDGQKNIQALIHNASGGANIFAKTVITSLIPANAEYTLPADIYAVNSIMNVLILSGSGITQSLPYVDFKERRNIVGYSLFRNKLILSIVETSRSLQVLYQAKVPTLSKRVSKVTAVDTVANTITIDISNILVDDFQDLTDYVSTVDKFGNITAKALFIDEYDQGSATLTVEGDLGQVLDMQGQEILPGVSVGDYLTMGYSATTNSELPVETEPTLLSYVQRRILGKLSSNMLSMESSFTEQEASSINELFADNSTDPRTPPVLDSDYLLY